MQRLKDRWFLPIIADHLAHRLERIDQYRLADELLWPYLLT
jgi:hypothetical protein